MFEMKESGRRGLGCGDMYIGGSGVWGRGGARSGTQGYHDLRCDIGDTGR